MYTTQLRRRWDPETDEVVPVLPMVVDYYMIGGSPDIIKGTWLVPAPLHVMQGEHDDD